MKHSRLHCAWLVVPNISRSVAIDITHLNLSSANETFPSASAWLVVLNISRSVAVYITRLNLSSANETFTSALCLTGGPKHLTLRRYLHNTIHLFKRYKLKDPKDAIDPAKVTAHMLDIVTQALSKLGFRTKVTVVGPAVNFQIRSRETSFRYIDIDLVLYIKQGKWPPSADLNIPPKLMTRGVGLVPKVLEAPQDTKVWQISFTAAEIILFQDIDEDGGCRKKLLKIAKYLKLASKWPDSVSSYHLKTILMKMNREHPNKADWADSKIVPRFEELMSRFLTALKAGKLPRFFIPDFDLFKVKISVRPSKGWRIWSTLSRPTLIRAFHLHGHLCSRLNVWIRQQLVIDEEFFC